jgi:hypothetical protein
MVHALTEVRRVLVLGGRLVDLRPVASNWPIDVMIEGRAMLAGRAKHSSQIPNEIAANKAIAIVVHNGWFVKEREAFFEFAYYWQSIADMKAYAADRWPRRVVLPQPAIVAARRLVRQEPTRSKLRIRRKIRIASYRRAR